MALVVKENKSTSTKGKLGDTDRQPQRSMEIKVKDLIWEIIDLRLVVDLLLSL